MVLTMYVDSATIKRGDKTYVRHLLRESYREDGKIKHRTILNLSGCSLAEIDALKLAFKHKDKLASLLSLEDIESTMGKRIGAVFVLDVILKRVGITKALGTSRDARLAMLQVMARMIDQGSRLSAVRLAESHALCEILGIDKLDEDDLYANLSWLAEQQEEIEKALFGVRFPNTVPTLFLYDVTSAYLEGVENELGEFGYNRDRKKGKLQIVVGLLTGPDGLPVAVRVFKGNTNDTKTVSEQVRLLASSFGVKEVTLVGDRGMLKGPQIEALPDDFRYITAITKPQIARMLSEGTLQLPLFSERVCEVTVGDVRYVLRRNPYRAQQMAETRASKGSVIVSFAVAQTKYLAEHPKANAQKALERVVTKIKALKVDWLGAEESSRVISVMQDDAALANAALLDGCYVIKSDVPQTSADAQTLHDRYCDLENVERAFRTMKTAHLDLRPVYVHKASSTRGHVFVVMLALLVQRELERCWSELNITTQEGIDELGAITALALRLGNATVNTLPKPGPRAASLLERASVSLPSALPLPHARVHTKKKLSSERIRH
jgi:hypothetical protein